MRVVQTEGKRGSQKWLQRAVNRSPEVLNGLILPRLAGASQIVWRSPLADDGYAEYRNSQFLTRIGADRLITNLARFWPQRGPQWDGLALSDVGDTVLVEAKAHIGELCSPPTQASASSRDIIETAFGKQSPI